MFLAVVLIYWRIADAIPLVVYATFLDFFMIIIYATFVMALVSGILIQGFAEDKNVYRVEQVNRWSIRIIPALSISLYFLLFLSIPNIETLKKKTDTPIKDSEKKILNFPDFPKKK
ncbi:MAG: hypothetical protein ABSE74_06790 [Methanoregula sp.]|jgi:hypothetical protein